MAINVLRQALLAASLVLLANTQITPTQTINEPCAMVSAYQQRQLAASPQGMLHSQPSRAFLC
jgi:hypothetical protein